MVSSPSTGVGGLTLEKRTSIEDILANEEGDRSDGEQSPIGVTCCLYMILTAQIRMRISRLHLRQRTARLSGKFRHFEHLHKTR